VSTGTYPLTAGRSPTAPAAASALPPGPRRAALSTLRWLIRPIELMESCRLRHGDVFTLRLLGLGEVVFVSDPDLVKTIFTGDPQLLRAGEAARVLRPVVGAQSLLLLDGERHRRERKLMLPPLHGEHLRGYEALIGELTRSALAEWPREAPFALHPRLADLTLSVIIRVVYGVEDEDRRRRLHGAIRRLLDEGTSKLSFEVPALRRDFGPGSPWRRFKRLLAEVDALIHEEIRLRRATPGELESRHDVLSLLLQARREDGSRLSEGELRDELVTLLTAGHETTATALAWAFELLLRHPSAHERAVRAADDGDRAYLDAVVQEALRYRPVIPIVARRLAAPVELGDLRLPAGAVVSPCIYLVHRRADLYPDPYAFRPERFVGHGPGTYSWLPFGGGPRRCIGAAFAQMEMRQVLGEVLRALDLRASASKPAHVKRRSITLTPSDGTRVIAKGRA